MFLRDVYIRTPTLQHRDPLKPGSRRNLPLRRMHTLPDRRGRWFKSSHPNQATTSATKIGKDVDYHCELPRYFHRDLTRFYVCFGLGVVVKFLFFSALSDLGRELFLEHLDQLTDVNGRVAKLDRKISEICREREDCRRLSELPGVGPIIATALVASVEDARHFRSGRELAAWIGLVPRQYTTGGKPRLGGIGRRANHYLRRQMIHGARAVISRLASHDDRRSQWLKELVARRGFNKAIVALANKTAR